MKTHRSPVVRPCVTRGFTLIELLIVITIIALLAALSMGIFSMAQQSSARSRTTGTMQSIVNALERYVKENGGEYPQPANPDKRGQSAGATASIGGALMLYQILTGDGNDQIKLEGSKVRTSSNGIIEEEEKKYVINADFIPIKDSTGSGYRSKLNATAVNSDGYMIVDGFGHPFFYTHGSDGNAINTASYDVWSVAQAQVSEVFSKTEKQDPKITRPWIKNW